MSIFEKLREKIFGLSPAIQPEFKEQEDDIERIVSPIFKEVPPDNKSGKFLTEGFRSWAFIAINAIADEVSTNPIHLFKKSGSEWTEIEEHQVLDVINKPNAFQTKEEFFWLTAVFLLAEGEAPIYVNSRKNPTQMVLLNPDRLTINFSEGGIIGGYTYRQSNGTNTKIDPDQIIFIKSPSVITPFRGSGIMKHIATTLDLDYFIEEYLKIFFYNDTAPSAVLETAQELNKDIINRLRVQFTNRHQGVKNAHKLAVLEKGLTFKKISSDLSQLTLKELNDMIRDKVLAGFRVPKSVLGIVEDVNRANADASSYTFSKRAVLPKLNQIQAQFNQYFIPKFSDGDKLWLEFENPVQEDKILQAQYWQMAIMSGWMTPDEVREELGLEALNEPDEEDQPEDMPEESPEDMPEEMGGDEEIPEKAKRIRIKKDDAFTAIMKDILESEKVEPKKEYSGEEVRKYHLDKIAFIDPLEKETKDALKKNFRRQERELLNQLKGKSAKKGNSVNLQLDQEKEISLMIKLMSPKLAEAIEKESILASALLQVDNVLTDKNENVKKFIDKRTLKLGKETAKTTQADIDKIVKNWAEEGGSWMELRSDISEYFDGEGEAGANWRADMISRTELANATGFAQEQTYSEAGAIGKRWTTALDDVCEFCEAMEKKYDEAGIGENFLDKGDSIRGMNGGIFTNSFESVDTPPLHPNCRCDILPVFDRTKHYSDIRNLIDQEKAEDSIIQEQKKALAEKESDLAEKELAIQAKERAVMELAEQNRKKAEETEQIRIQAEKELKEIAEYNKKLDGKIK